MSGLFFMADTTPKTQRIKKLLEKKYGSVSLNEADCVVVLGGDGFMLRALRHMIGKDIPVFGLNLGHMGVLLNPYSPHYLTERIEVAQKNQPVFLKPLCVDACTIDQKKVSYYAFNDCYLERMTAQVCDLNIEADHLFLKKHYHGDGTIVAMPTGSLAYYRSAGGMPFPLESQCMGIKSICAYPFESQFQTLVPDTTTVRVQVLNTQKRPVKMVCDNQEVPFIKKCQIRTDASKAIPVLFDPKTHLSMRILQACSPSKGTR